MTWPLTRNIDCAVAWSGDPYINTWILDWDWYATLHRPLHLFEANAFYPSHDSLAFSENMYGIALVLFPFRAMGVSPIAAHNIAVILGFALSGFGAYLLGRYISSGGLAGVVSGIFYAFVPFRFTHLTHVQHVWAGTLPLMLLALLWYAEKSTWPRAALFAGSFLLNGLCNIHWLLFGTIAIAMTAAVLRPRWIPLTACSTVAALLIAGFLYPYFIVEKMYGMQRSAAETLNFSAVWSDWLVSDFHNRFYIALRDPRVDPERWLFPGALSLLIGAIAFLSTDRKSLKVAATWTLIGLFGSFGLNFIFHEFLFAFVPGFRAIRVPARWAAIAYVGLAMLVAIGTAMIARRRVWVNALIAIAFIIELHAAPIRWFMAPTDAPPVYRWIGKEKPNAIAELPIRPDGEYLAMLRATTHHRPMVNGISGFAPPERERIDALANSFSDQFFPELQRLGVSHVIAHADSFDAAGRQWLGRALANKQLAFLRRFDAGVGGDWLFKIGGTSSISTSELEAMLRGEVTRNDGTFGAMFTPVAGTFDGFAFSPYGIRAVNLLLNNGAIRLSTNRLPDPQLQRKFPWYPATTAPRFTARFQTRPAGVWQNTDIQAEIIDGRGERVLLDDRWIDWP